MQRYFSPQIYSFKAGEDLCTLLLSEGVGESGDESSLALTPPKPRVQKANEKDSKAHHSHLC